VSEQQKFEPLYVRIQEALVQVVSEHPRETEHGLVIVRAKGPGSKNADGSYTAMWLDVIAKGDLGGVLASARKRDRIVVAGDLREGRLFAPRDGGEPRAGGLVLWASNVRFVDTPPVSKEPAHDFDAEPIPF